MIKNTINKKASLFNRRTRKNKLNIMFDKSQICGKNSDEKIVSLVIFIFVLITIYTLFVRTEYKWNTVNLNLAKETLKKFFQVQTVSHELKIKMVRSLINTVALGFLSTLFGFCVGLIVSIFAARNITMLAVSNIIRVFAGLIRAVPTIIWVLIFVAGYGLSATTAVVGMFFHTLAFFIRALAESFEEVDKDTIEALMAAGASKMQIIFGAVIPSALTKIISWFSLRFEQNFGTAVIIGPAVGVPGTIGTMINNASRTGDYSSLGFGVFLIFITALILELMMNKIRQKNIVS